MVDGYICADGRLTIPKEIRKELGLKKGSILEVEARDDCIILKPIRGEEQPSTREDNESKHP